MGYGSRGARTYKQFFNLDGTRGDNIQLSISPRPVNRNCAQDVTSLETKQQCDVASEHTAISEAATIVSSALATRATHCTRV